MLRKSISCVLLSILLTSILMALKTNPVRSQSTITVPDDYSTIQEAINNAYEGDTIFIKNGTYSAIVVDKSLNLYGENRYATIIENGSEPYGAGVRILADNVRISNFTIQNARGPPIRVHGDTGPSYGNITISDNIMTGCGEPVRLINTSGNVMSGNVIRDSSGGIGFDWASGNIVHNNTLINVGVGIVGGYPSYNNTFSENTIMGNGNAISMNGIFDNNTFFHNSFINNTIQVAISPTMVNDWDNGCEGNYWSDYIGIDSDGDGVGDTPYIIDVFNQDNCPLMSPYMPGDINHDAIVDIFDIAKIAVVFGSTPLDPNWNPHCNINQDNIIDIFDLVTVAINFGKEWSPP